MVDVLCTSSAMAVAPDARSFTAELISVVVFCELVMESFAISALLFTVSAWVMTLRSACLSSCRIPSREAAILLKSFIMLLGLILVTKSPVATFLTARDMLFRLFTMLRSIMIVKIKSTAAIAPNKVELTMIFLFIDALFISFSSLAHSSAILVISVR